MKRFNEAFDDTRQRSYGNVPAQTSSLIMPEMRPDFVPFVNQPPTQSSQFTAPTHQQYIIPKPIETKTYESFEAPQNVKQPYYFAEQDHADRFKKEYGEKHGRNCPNCLGSTSNFKLANDPTDSVYCAACRQPYHFCRVHAVALPGMGRNLRDPQLNQCQCTRSQPFLNDNNWNSCFNK